MTKKCGICGEKTHLETSVHLGKDDAYNMVANLNLKNRTNYFAWELVDFLAGYLGRTFVLVKRKRHSTGWFSSAPAIMLHEAKPKPIKVLQPNGLVVWHTDNLENMPSDAKEHEIRKKGVKITELSSRCLCGHILDLEPAISGKKIKCHGCGKRFEFETRPVAVRVWGKEITSLGGTLKLVEE